MANDVVGAVGFNCTGKGEQNKGTIFKDITVQADPHSRPSDILLLFEQEAQRLGRITGSIQECKKRAAFSGDVKVYLDARRGVFTCKRGNGEINNIYHDVYTVRLKDEPPEETQRRLAVDAVMHHKGVIALDCKGDVDFSGEFVGPMMTGSLSRTRIKQSTWSLFKESIKNQFNTLVGAIKEIPGALADAFRPSQAMETRRRIAEEYPGWSYDR